MICGFDLEISFLGVIVYCTKFKDAGSWFSMESYFVPHVQSNWDDCGIHVLTVPVVVIKFARTAGWQLMTILRNLFAKCAKWSGKCSHHQFLYVGKIASHLYPTPFQNNMLLTQNRVASLDNEKHSSSSWYLSEQFKKLSRIKLLNISAFPSSLI